MLHRELIAPGVHLNLLPAENSTGAAFRCSCGLPQAGPKPPTMPCCLWCWSVVTVTART